MAIRLLLFGSLALALCACTPPGNTPPVVKIGLIAPFEGPSRPIGYSVLYGVRLRLQQWNDNGNSPRVELVALNDNSNPDLAAQLPIQLAVDPDVLLVLGPPQGHTALAALNALTENELPSISLAPLPDDSLPRVASFAGGDADLQTALAPYMIDGPVIREQPLVEPSIWVGDPQSLAEIVTTRPSMILASGVVAADPAFVSWAGAASDGMIWASATPRDLPSDFVTAYQALAGSPPQPISALAYAATDQALQLVTKYADRPALLNALGDIPTPPIQVYQRQGDECCLIPFSNP